MKEAFYRYRRLTVLTPAAFVMERLRYPCSAAVSETYLQCPGRKMNSGSFKESIILPAHP